MDSIEPTFGLAARIAPASDDHHRAGSHPFEVPLALAKDRVVYKSYIAISQSLLRISKSAEPVFRSVAQQCVETIEARLERIAQGTIDFDETETWRIVYEQLLQLLPSFSIDQSR
ncbi:MAG: hypothetical protein R3C56_42390 [Pirellulaceae bacterium]